jgi:hypothetical protein
MKPEKMKSIQEEIQEVANRNGIARWAFCGEFKDRKFIGMMERKHLTCGSAMLTIINVGRLWQYARQNCRGLLDSYERLP